MTNLELAKLQGNQAAPNLLNAAAAGELGGGGSVFPSLSTAGFVLASMSFTLSSDQADEAAANTIYANCKLVTDNHLDMFELKEEYLTYGDEYSEDSEYYYFAFNAHTLARIKTLAAIVPDIPSEIFDNIEPDELCTFDAEGARLIQLIFSMTISFGIDELPPLASGIIELIFTPADDDSPLLPAGSSIYQLESILAGTTSSDQALLWYSYYAESLLDAPVKLDKTYYMIPSQL